MSGYFDLIKELYRQSCTAMEDMQGIHAETLVASLAALSGELLLRACKIDFSKFPAGGVILADQIADSAPLLLGYLEQLLGHMQIEADDWSGLIPIAHQPFQEPLPLAKKLREPVFKIQRTYGLDDNTLAHALTMVLALVIRDIREIVPPQAAVAVSCNYLMRAAKSVPLADD